MGVIAEGILRGCQGLFTPVSLGYPLSVFNKNSTLKKGGFPGADAFLTMNLTRGPGGVCNSSRIAKIGMDRSVFSNFLLKIRKVSVKIPEFFFGDRPIQHDRK